MTTLLVLQGWQHQQHHHHHHHHRQLSVLSSSNNNSHPEDATVAYSSDTTATTNSTAENPQLLNVLSGKQASLGPGFSVRRILPMAKQRSVGPFIFLDHFDTHDNLMNVGPHPHIGLTTLTYLYHGMILHRDSTGAQQVIRPGGVNAMVAGRGVTHSERGQSRDIQDHWKQAANGEPAIPESQMPTSMHGLQLWMALSRQGEDVEPSFHHGSSVPMTKTDDTKHNTTGGVEATLVVGRCNGLEQSDIPLDVDLGRVVFVDIDLAQRGSSFTLHDLGGSRHQPNEGADATAELQVGVYVSTGQVEATFPGAPHEDDDGDDNHSHSTTTTTTTTIDAGQMAVWNMSSGTQLQLTGLQNGTRVAVVGGTPLSEPRHLLWNFCSHSKSKLQRAAQAWKELDRTVFPKVVGESNDDSIPLPTRSSPR